jgi:RIO kinase 1
MDFDAFEHPAIESFTARGLIDSVLHEVKSGKEATVLCCRGGPAAGAELVAAKIYRPREHRSFRNDARYQEGRTWARRPSRALRALEKKSRFGLEVQAATWVGHEHATLADLHAAGLDVPRPIAAADGGLLMEFVQRHERVGEVGGSPSTGGRRDAFGDGERAAPPLHACDLAGPGEAQAVLDRVLANVERMLARNVVHGDLSAYNVLYRGAGDLRVIDLPQAVDPRFNGGALELLRRDIANVHRHCARFGARGDPDAIAHALWRRFERGELGR